MLQIEPRQIDALATVANTALARTVADVVGFSLGPDPQYAAARILEHAHNFGVTERFDILNFARCLMVIGLDFWHDPSLGWAGDILGDADMTGTDKVIQIDGHIALFLDIDVAAV